MTGRYKFTLADFPVRAREHKGGDGDEEENARENGVGLERQNEKCEQREAPHDQIEGDDGIKLGRGFAGEVAGGRIWGPEAEGGELEHAEREPEDGEDTANHLCEKNVLVSGVSLE